MRIHNEFNVEKLSFASRMIESINDADDNGTNYLACLNSRIIAETKLFISLNLIPKGEFKLPTERV